MCTNLNKDKCKSTHTEFNACPKVSAHTDTWICGSMSESVRAVPASAVHLLGLQNLTLLTDTE